MTDNKPRFCRATLALGLLILLGILLVWLKMQSFGPAVPKPIEKVEIALDSTRSSPLLPLNTSEMKSGLPGNRTQTGSQLPPHDRYLTLTFSGGTRGVKLVTKRIHSGMIKSMPPPDGRYGVYVMAKSKDGPIICHGVLPDPFEVRAFPAQAPGAAEPIPQLDDTTFMVRLPMVANLNEVELYYIPRSAAPSDPPNNQDRLLGRFPLSE
jgi:hypothetical protein